MVAHKDTDLRDHFKRLTSDTGRSTTPPNTVCSHDELVKEYAQLRAHCTNLEQLVQRYAGIINEHALENEALRQQACGFFSPFKAAPAAPLPAGADAAASARPGLRPPVGARLHEEPGRHHEIDGAEEPEEQPRCAHRAGL